MKFLNPNFSIEELIKEEEYIIVYRDKSKKTKIEKRIFNDIKIKNRKEIELYFEKVKLIVETSDTIDCVENKINENIIIFRKNTKNKNIFIEMIIKEIMKRNIKQDENIYLKTIEETIKKIKKL